MSMSEAIMRWRYRAVPDHLLGEILSKRWVDNAIPLMMLLIVVQQGGILVGVGQSLAAAMPVTMFVMPGPFWPVVTPTRPLTRA